MRPHNRLTSPHDTRTRLAAQLIRNQQEQETALQEINAKEEGHVAQIRVVVENLVDGLGSGHGVAGGGDEGLRGDPEVCVVEERDGVPFAVDEDVQGVHEVRAVGEDGLGLEVRGGHALLVGGGGADGVGACAVDVGVVVGGVVFGQVWHCRVAGFEVLQAAAVGFELFGDFVGLLVPFGVVSYSKAETGVVAGVVEVNDFS